MLRNSVTLKSGLLRPFQIPIYSIAYRVATTFFGVSNRGVIPYFRSGEYLLSRKISSSFRDRRFGKLHFPDSVGIKQLLRSSLIPLREALQSFPKGYGSCASAYRHRAPPYPSSNKIAARVNSAAILLRKGYAPHNPLL